MYFNSRAEAGAQLAKQIVKDYHGKDSVVLALNDGGVVVGSQIALALDCPLNLLLTEVIELPRENMAVGAVSQDGSFSYNHAFSEGEISELTGEYRNLIEQEKMTKIQELHQAGGKGSTLSKELLENRNIIVVTDGLRDGFTLDVAAQFLKPVHVKKLIVATPLASIRAVDYMHIMADDIFCLSVPEDYIETEHYYERQDIPSHAKVIEVVEQIIAHWRAKLKAAKAK